MRLTRSMGLAAFAASLAHAQDTAGDCQGTPRYRGAGMATTTFSLYGSHVKFAISEIRGAYGSKLTRAISELRLPHVTAQRRPTSWRSLVTRTYSNSFR
jgi:hypothetical protein